jgi:hypothetical protein
MSRLLTTSQLAAALRLAPSTVRHYRSAGRLKPQTQTPGGHARWDLDQVRRDLGYSENGGGSITGLKVDTFAPAGQHDIRSDAPSGPLPLEMVALGVREESEPITDASRHRWGGALLGRRAGVAA